MHKLHNKRFIYTVTTGRSGSNFITQVFSCLDDTISLHEPKPRYDRIMRTAQHYPAIAKQFLLEKKLPAIELALSNKKNYFESSHLFCKGFLEAWLNIEGLPIPNLICLNRSHREISLSFTRLNSIPSRTFNGLTYLLSPFDPSTLTTLKGINEPITSKFNDYQMCYWYCLEMEQRKKHYSNLVIEKGGQSLQVSVKDLKELSAFNTFCDTLELPRLGFWGQKRFHKMTKTVINTKSDKKKHLEFIKEELTEWEKQVRDSLILREQSE